MFPVPGVAEKNRCECGGTFERTRMGCMVDDLPAAADQKETERDDTAFVQSCIDRGIPIPFGEYVVRGGIDIPMKPESRDYLELRKFLDASNLQLRKELAAMHNLVVDKLDTVGVAPFESANWRTERSRARWRLWCITGWAAALGSIAAPFWARLVAYLWRAINAN